MNEMMEAIESIEFEAWMNIHSGLRPFFKSIQHDERVLKLISAIARCPDDQQALYDRFLHVLYLQQTLGYMHPHDTGLAAYLYALHETAPELAQQAAAHALRVPEAWWTGRVAKLLMEPTGIEPVPEAHK